MTDVKIKYVDIAPGAKEAFAPSISDNESFANVENIRNNAAAYRNYGNPCETYSVLLDNSSIPFPENPAQETFGVFSKQISGEDGAFDSPIVLTLQSSQQFASQGIAFSFDTANNFYPISFLVQWFRGETMISEKEFYPDSATFFCQNYVEGFDKIVVAFPNWNMPQNRFKMESVDYGRVLYFYGSDLRSIKIIQEVDPISSEIAINAVDFTIDKKTDFDFKFQEKQPLSVFFGENLQATTFVKTAKRKTKTAWDISTEDYIGLMDSVPFYGGIYANKNAGELFSQIFSTARVPYLIDDSISEKTISGHIPVTSCRDALMQVAFAVQAIVDTSESEKVKVYEPQNDSVLVCGSFLCGKAVVGGANAVLSIPAINIMQGQSFREETKVTGVEIVSHSYSKGIESLEAYKSEDSGSGVGMFVEFSEPLYDLTIVNGAIVESGANYAVIDAYDNCVLSGKKFIHTKTARIKKNPVFLSNDIENIVRIDSATLVSPSNVDAVLDKCYNFLVNTSFISCRVVERNGIKVAVGNKVKVATEYLGDKVGRVIKQSFGYSGGSIVKDVEIR